MRAIAVIGSGFGDEGKGAAVDALVASYPAPCVVVRSNGGAQAGHTVVTPQGYRHVFHHFGAGALAGASTFLSRFFVCNPHTFMREFHELEHLPANVSVTIDHASEVTTPYDIIINRWLEVSRGAARHGSCGMGFGETLERVSHGIRFQAGVAFRAPASQIRAAVEAVRKYAIWRLEQLGIWEKVDDDRRGDLLRDDIVTRYLEEIGEMASIVGLGKITDTQAVGRKMVVFEGAQGLLLDQGNGYLFPFVTRSNTGVRNVSQLCRELECDLEVLYATRPYTTRHGAGPLIGEAGSRELEGIKVIDDTNMVGPWQGKLRLAPLMIEQIAAAIDLDLSYASGLIRDAGFTVSCCDQVEEQLLSRIINEASLRLPVPPKGEAWGTSRDERDFFIGEQRPVPLISEMTAAFEKL